MSESEGTEASTVVADEPGSNEDQSAKDRNLVSLDTMASQYEFPLLAKLHLAPQLASEYESEWNAQQLQSTKLQVLGFRTFQRMLLSVRTKASDRTHSDNGRKHTFTLSSTAKVAVKVAPLDAGKVYRTTRELVRDFPRYVRVLQDIQYRADFLIKSGEVLELLRVEKRCVKVRGLIDVLVCRHFYREVQFAIDMTTWLCCSPLVDDTVYMLSDLVRRFPLPRIVLLQNPHLLKTTATARKALREQQLPVEFIIHELATHTFAVGMSDDSASQPPLVVYLQSGLNPSNVANSELSANASDSQKNAESTAFDQTNEPLHDELRPCSPDQCTAPRVQVLDSNNNTEPAVQLDEIADFPYLDLTRRCVVQVCALDDVLDGALRQPLGAPLQQYSFANYAVRKSVALHEFSSAGLKATPGLATCGDCPHTTSTGAFTHDARQPVTSSCCCATASGNQHNCAASATPQTARKHSVRNELHGYIADSQAKSVSKSSASFGNMIKKRVVRLFSSKQNVNITVTSAAAHDHANAKQRSRAKTGSAPNLHNCAYSRASQNSRTFVDIPMPGSSISSIISTPSRAKRSPKFLRRPPGIHRGEMRNSCVSLHSNVTKARSDSMSSLPQHRYNLVDLDIDIPDELLAAQFGNTCVLADANREDTNKPITLTFSSSQLQSLGNTPSTTPTSTAVWYPNGCLPHQVSLYNLHMQPHATGAKLAAQRNQFEFPPTPKQSMSNGTNSLSSGNEEASSRTKQESSVSLASINCVSIDDLTVQQLSDYLRRHNLERISLLCEQHSVDGPFFLDLTEEDLNGYPFCASPFEVKCIRRLQKGILPKCD